MTWWGLGVYNENELNDNIQFHLRIDLDLRRLRLFVEVVKQGGFSRAARTVFASQPTISKAVKQLEDELGSPLLNRVGQHSELTTAGKVVYDRAVELLAQAESLVSECEELRGLRRGVLRLGFPRLGSSAIFAAAFVSFKRKYPGIEVETGVQDTRQLEERLRAGQLDLAVLIHPLAEGLESQNTRSDELVVLLRRDHPLANRTEVKLKELAGFPFILFEEGFRLNEVILQACQARGIAPKIATRSGQIDFIFELVAAGSGLAFLPRVVAELRPHPRVRIARLAEPGCKLQFSFAWRRGAYLSHAARAWLDHIREREVKKEV